MKEDNVVPFEAVVKGGIWKATNVDKTPVIELTNWMVVEVTPSNNRHLIGYNITEGEGRTSSSLVSFDKETMTGITRSGRRYKLVDKPGINGDAVYTFNNWCQVNQIQSYEDVSDEYE